MMPEDFDLSNNGLQPCHVRELGGHIFVNLSGKKDPPPFPEDEFWMFAKTYGTCRSESWCARILFCQSQLETTDREFC